MSFPSGRQGPAEHRSTPGTSAQRRLHIRSGIALTATALAVGFLPALSSPASGAVTVGDNITAFPNRDMVGAFGYEPGEMLTIDIVRGGVVVATTTGPAGTTPEGVGLEVNHGPEGVTPNPGECWDGVTPDLRGGDLIRVTTLRGVDEMTVTNLDILSGPAEGANGEVFVEGVASAADGTRLPAGAFAAEFRFDDAEPRFRRGPLAPEYQGETGTTWRASYDPATDVAAEGYTVDEMRNMALDDASWMAVEDKITVTTIAEFGEPGGPAPGCEDVAPADPNTVAAGFQDPVNITSGDVMLSGTAAGGVTSVSITVGTLAPRSIPLDGGSELPQPWSVTIPKAELMALSDGPVTVESSFDGVAGTTRTMLKDTVAPQPPTASPEPGSYGNTQNVTLTRPAGEQGSRILWVIGTGAVADPDGSSQEYSTQIAVSSSQTIKALVVDRAGNSSPVATFGYQIGTPAGGGSTPPTGGGSTPPGDGGPGPVIPPDDGGTGTPPPAEPGGDPVTRTVVVHAAADTMIRQHRPNRRAGERKTLLVDRQQDAGTRSRVSSLIRFTFPRLAPGERITGAMLRLAVVDGTTDGPVVWKVDNRWREGHATWAHRPERLGTSAVADFGEVSVGRAVAAIDGIPGSGGVSFELVAQSANGVGFASSERRPSKRPRLILTITGQ